VGSRTSMRRSSHAEPPRWTRDRCCNICCDSPPVDAALQPPTAGSAARLRTRLFIEVPEFSAIFGNPARVHGANRGSKSFGIRALRNFCSQVFYNQNVAKNWGGGTPPLRHCFLEKRHPPQAASHPPQRVASDSSKTPMKPASRRKARWPYLQSPSTQ
jgi:hypothetical protein